MGLQQITEGTVGWATTMNNNIAFLRLPPGHANGPQLSYSSTTQVKMAAGSCRDDSDATDMTVGGIETLDITTGESPALSTTAGTVDGIDVRTRAPTLSTTTASQTATPT